MSAVVANDVFSFDEDSFPSLLDRKPSAARRARGLSERKGEAPHSTIVKSFMETGLGRRRRAKLLSECEDELACDVPYSLHRKNRWAEMDAPSLLGDGGDEVAVAVVERAAARKGTRLVSAVHFVDREGARRTAVAKGKGTDQENLLAEVKESERPVLLYSLCKTPAGEKATKALQKKTSRRAGAFCMTSDDAYVPSESEEVVVEEMPVWRRSREPSFCLGDYIVSKEYVCPSSTAAKTEQHSRSREASPALDMTAYVEVAAPSDSSGPSLLLVASGTHKTIEISAGHWTSGAHEQMRALATSAYYTRWLDANERRLMVDLSTAVCSHCAGRFLLVVIFEKMHATKNIRMTINCVDDLDLSSLPSADSLDALLHNTVALAVEKFNDARPPVEHAAKFNPSLESTGSLVDRDTVLAEHRDLSITASSDDFDRILDSDDEEEAIVSGVRCNKCCEANVDDLFEMEEDWLCRSCLTQTICAILGNRMLVKLNVPIACHSLCTPMDALPLFVPLACLNKYMRSLSMAIAEILKGDDLIVECKLCLNLVRLKDGFEASVLACPGCGGVSCLSCGRPPHHPMSCEEFDVWSGRFDAQIESLRIEANPKFARAITCECGQEMVLPQDQKETTCSRCHVVFDAVSLKKKRGGGCMAARAASLVPLPARAIAKEFAAVAAAAHAERVDDRRRAVFERAARKMRGAAAGGSTAPFDADAALALRATALHAAEMHAGAAYLARARGPRSASLIMAAWEALRTGVQEEREEKRATRALEALKEVLKEAGAI